MKSSGDVGGAHRAALGTPRQQVEDGIADRRRVSTELTYTLEQLTGDTIVVVGHNETATSTDTMTIVPNPCLLYTSDAADE